MTQAKGLVNLNIKYEDLMELSQDVLALSGFKVHWRATESTSTCGTKLDYLIWADEEQEAVTCLRCLSGLNGKATPVYPG